MNTQEHHTSTSTSRLRKKAKLLKPAVWIGKSGITESVIEEINKQVKKKRLIKVKLLNSYVKERNKKEAAREIAERSNTTIMDQVGFVVVLSKKD